MSALRPPMIRRALLLCLLFVQPLFAYAGPEDEGSPPKKVLWGRRADVPPAAPSTALQPVQPAGADFLLSSPAYRLLPDHVSHRDTVKLAKILYPSDDLVRKMVAKRETLSRMSHEIYKRLLQAPEVIESPIPPIFHRVWLTKPEAPQGPDEIMVARILESHINLAPGARHILWCDDEAPLPAQRLREAGIEIRLVSSFFAEIARAPLLMGEDGQILAKHVYQALRDDTRNTIASDIFRRLVVFYYGGVYTDMGFRVERDFSLLLNAYECIFYLYASGNIDLRVIGFRPGDPLLRKDLEFIHTLWKNPQREALRSSYRGAPQQLYITGYHSFMALLDTHAPDTARILFLPAEEIPNTKGAALWRLKSNAHMSVVRGQSWNGRGDPKNNISVFASKLDLFGVKP